MYNQGSAGYKARYGVEVNEPLEGKWQREESGYGARVRPASKENVMKRAEEEAARKI